MTLRFPRMRQSLEAWFLTYIYVVSCANIRIVCVRSLCHFLVVIDIDDGMETRPSARNRVHHRHENLREDATDCTRHLQARR